MSRSGWLCIRLTPGSASAATTRERVMKSDRCRTNPLDAAMPSTCALPQAPTRTRVTSSTSPYRWLGFIKILACVFALILPPGTHAGSLAAADNLAALRSDTPDIRRPIMLFFTQPGCIFCEQARRQYIRPLASDARWNARTLSIEVSRAQKLRDFDGVETTGAEIARRYGVRVYPTVVFVDTSGKSLADPIAGFTVPDFYGAYLEDRLQQASARLNRN